MTDVLFVCTGNLCRSPSAERFLAERLAGAGPHHVTVESAGTLSTSMAVPSALVAEAAKLGLDLSDHVPRKVDSATVQRADLVIGMARQHVREVVVTVPGSFARSFTLRDLVRRGSEWGPRKRKQSLSEWLEQISAGRRQVELIGDAPLEDIPDPIGGSAEDFRVMLKEVYSLTDALFHLVWPVRKDRHKHPRSR